MKSILVAAALAAACLATSGCASGSSSFMAAATEIAKDPNCAHTDRVNVTLGGMTGATGSVFLERNCAAATPAQAATVIAPAPAVATP